MLEVYLHNTEKALLLGKCHSFCHERGQLFLDGRLLATQRESRWVLIPELADVVDGSDWERIELAPSQAA